MRTMEENKNLILHKASAGSGKTFNLALQYISFLLTERENGLVRLRRGSELEVAARSILAVTFTNKATAEMKERIVARLGALANPPASGLSKEDEKFLEYFTGTLRLDECKLHETARESLHILLNNYSDFQVSTIDSFFQTVLRTFAYEVDLADSFELELDSDYVSRAALDATLNEMQEVEGKGAVRAWVSHLMRDKSEEAGNGWNIFDRKTYTTSLYGTLYSVFRNMDTEKYKAIREEMKEWFDAHPEFLHELQELQEKFDKPVKERHAAAREAAKRAIHYYNTTDFGDGKNSRGGIKGATAAVIDSKSNNSPKISNAEKRESDFRIDSSQLWRKMFLKGYYERHQSDAQVVHMMELAADFYGKTADWLHLKDMPYYRLWEAYSQNLKYLWMMNELDRRATEMVEEENMVRISDTNIILSRIIGEDDVPFVYERLGTRIDHFLIDEFQDTSAMQWDNFRPLLSETLARAEESDSFVIGDPKQSIYRFRNADPTVITNKVPTEFHERIDYRGLTPSENTNYRSKRTVVEFNNSLFTGMACYADRLEPAGSTYFKDLYAQVVQICNDKERIGYVEGRVKGVGKSSMDESEEDYPPYYKEIASLIASLINERGWRKRDIAVLVRTNKEGKQIIRALVDYNLHRADGLPPITFVSEESLLVSSSPAVQSVVSVIRLLAEGLDPEPEDTAEKGKREKSSSLLFNCRFRIFALRHAGKSDAEVLRLFLADEEARQLSIPNLVPMRSMALPQLVERIIHDYIGTVNDDALDNTPYLAAFQDAVLNYVERGPSDVASFLQWWDAHSQSLTVASSKGADDVNIMTIHKAKGLQFPVVIMPNTSDQLGINPRKGGEWMWLRPNYAALALGSGEPELPDGTLPPFVPVPAMLKYADIPVLTKAIEQHDRQVRMDAMNLLYVGFTRAVDEMYFYAPERGPVISNILPELPTSQNEEDCLLPADTIATEPEQGEGDEQKVIFQAGTKLSREQIAEIHAKVRRNKDVTFSGYDVRKDTDFLAFKVAEGGGIRETGIKLHGIMARVNVASDLDQALVKARVKGEITGEEQTEFGHLLRESMKDKRVADWFAPGLRVYNERTLLAPGYKGERRQLRPDRVVIDQEGNIMVIDYKFGETDHSNAYVSQVRRYKRILRQAFKQYKGTVRGYIWHVLNGEIEEV